MPLAPSAAACEGMAAVGGMLGIAIGSVSGADKHIHTPEPAKVDLACFFIKCVEEGGEKGGGEHTVCGGHLHRSQHKTLRQLSCEQFENDR